MKINREQIRERIMMRKDLISNYTNGDMDSLINLVHVSVNSLDENIDDAIKKFGTVYNVISEQPCEGSCDYQLSAFAKDLRNEKY